MTEYQDSTVLTQRIAALAEEKKARDVVALDLRGLTLIADYFLIMTAGNTRQAQAISDHIYETMKDGGLQATRIEGYRDGQWILLDYGDVAVHIFLEEQRSFYDLERLWGRVRQQAEEKAEQQRQQ